MVYLKLMTIAMIVVLQVCTANPVSSKEENDVTKLFTEDELARANSIGMSHRALVRGKSSGLTFEQMIQLQQLKNDTTPSAQLTVEHLSKVCKIVLPGHETPSNYTRAQEEELRNLLEVSVFIPMTEELSFVRTSVCGYISQPHSFDPKFIPHTKIRFLKTHAVDVTGVDRVRIAKQMCCIDEGGNIWNRGKPQSNELPDNEMNELDKQWNNFDTTNVSESIKKLCDFVHAKNSVYDYQCQKNGSSP